MLPAPAYLLLLLLRTSSSRTPRDGPWGRGPVGPWGRVYTADTSKAHELTLKSTPGIAVTRTGLILSTYSLSQAFFPWWYLRWRLHVSHMVRVYIYVSLKAQRQGGLSWQKQIQS